MFSLTVTDTYGCAVSAELSLDLILFGLDNLIKALSPFYYEINMMYLDHCMNA